MPYGSGFLLLTKWMEQTVENRQPATVGGLGSDWQRQQGGASGWFRSMAIPRRWFPEQGGWSPWELPSLSWPVGHRLILRNMLF